MTISLSDNSLVVNDGTDYKLLLASKTPQTYLLYEGLSMGGKIQFTQVSYGNIDGFSMTASQGDKFNFKRLTTVSGGS